jgi:hypothetical protein
MKFSFPPFTTTWKINLFFLQKFFVGKKDLKKGKRGKFLKSKYFFPFPLFRYMENKSFFPAKIKCLKL